MRRWHLLPRFLTENRAGCTVFSAVGLVLLSLLLGVGFFRAYVRGANDFSVFYEAWKLVLSGNGSKVYQVTIDRFLYSPGFAWGFSPLAFFSKEGALAIWCTLKLILIIILLKQLSEGWSSERRLGAWGLTAWGFVLIAKPLLIDLEYGQVNLFILFAAVMALKSHLNPKSSVWNDGLNWLLLGFIAAAKLFPLPLLVVPWVRKPQGYHLRQKIVGERVALSLGVLLSAFLPLFIIGIQSHFELLRQWGDALVARGLPLESHNQSFTALLHHYFSGDPTAVKSEGMQPLMLGNSWLTLQQINLISLSWVAAALGILLGWLVGGDRSTQIRWIAVSVGLMIVPSHLIWKPYFVLSIPLAVCLVQQAANRKTILNVIGVAVLFILINLTGFDFLGHSLAAHLEAGSFLLFIHLVMIGLVVGRQFPIWKQKQVSY